MNMKDTTKMAVSVSAAALILGLTAPRPALAYIDPGTGSAVFGGLAYLLALGGAALSVVLLLVRKFWGGFRRLFTGRRSEKG
jgi:hypothetical protein